MLNKLEISEKSGEICKYSRFVVNPRKVGKLDESIYKIVQFNYLLFKSDNEDLTNLLPKREPNDQVHPTSLKLG